MPTLASQDVVSAAGGEGVHCLQANTRLHQCTLQVWGGEFEFAAAAEDDEFWGEMGELLEMLGRELGERDAMPIEAFTLRADDDGMLHFFLLRLPIHEKTNADTAGAVASDDLGVGFVRL